MSEESAEHPLVTLYVKLHILPLNTGLQTAVLHPPNLAKCHHGGLKSQGSAARKATRPRKGRTQDLLPPKVARTRIELTQIGETAAATVAAAAAAAIAQLPTTIILQPLTSTTISCLMWACLAVHGTQQGYLI